MKGKLRRRKIAVVTGARADYGLLYWIIKFIKDDPSLLLQLIVTGSHLEKRFGHTINEIIKDGFPIAGRVKLPLYSDSERSLSIAMGSGIIGFAKEYSRLKPDILLVLGDRFEIFSAVAAALPFRLPVAHIQGGESTEGLIDESIRHALTKMSHVHFTSHEIYSRRVIQMGEEPSKVFCFGSPGIDNIYKLKLLGRDELFRSMGIASKNNIGICTYHPVTLENNSSKEAISQILKAINSFPDIFWVFTSTNADTTGKIIMKMIRRYLHSNSGKGKLFYSLGQLKYLSLLKHAELMLGNSSSGIIEAPYFRLPVVNIGDRQKGRIRSKNIIDAKECKTRIISQAIRKALSIQFRDSIEDIDNPYGNGDASGQIVSKLKEIKLGEVLLKKEFFDFER